jgi:hypothetical protein
MYFTSAITAMFSAMYYTDKYLMLYDSKHVHFENDKAKG